MYRTERMASDRVAAVSDRLLAADRELLAGAGTLAAVRREIERAVAVQSGRIHGPGYPSSARLIEALSAAQAHAFAAAQEVAAADALLERGSVGGCTMLPDAPRLGASPPADARSRKWWPAPFDPLGALVWYLRYRPWWSTLDAAERLLHRDRLALRERERELVARGDPLAPRESLPPLDEVTASP